MILNNKGISVVHISGSIPIRKLEAHTHSEGGQREPAFFLWMGIQNADIHASFPVEPLQPKYQEKIQVSHNPKAHHEVTSVKATYDNSPKTPLDTFQAT